MAITFMTKDGYRKKMEEIAYLENVKRPEISRAIADTAIKATLARMLNMMQLKRLRVCWR